MYGKTPSCLHAKNIGMYIMTHAYLELCNLLIMMSLMVRVIGGQWLCIKLLRSRDKNSVSVEKVVERLMQ